MSLWDRIRGSRREVAARDDGRTPGGSEVHIGLDFGTSTSKVVVFWEALQRREVVGWRSPLSSATSLVVPTTVGLELGRLRFGANAEHLPADASVRSFKVCIACQAGLHPCPRCTDSDLRPGLLAVGAGRDLELEASEIATLYLAWLLGQVDDWLLNHPEVAPAAERTVNSAAPLDQLEHRGLDTAFRLVLHRAMQLRGEVADYLPVQEARRLLEQAAAAVPEPLDEAEARAFVVPEACAATYTAVHGPGARRRRYAVLDVGAGSTDVGIFWCWETKDHAPVWTFYSSTTVFVAGDDMDRSLLGELAARGLAKGPAEDLRRLRRAKPRELGEGMRWDAAELTGDEYEQAMHEVVGRIFKTYRQTFGRARQDKLPMQNDWPDLDILLAGGGSRCWPLRKKLAGCPPMHGFCEGLSVRTVELPRDLLWDRSIPEEQRHDVSDLLAVAVGLSHPIGDLPRYEGPAEIGLQGPGPDITGDGDFFPQQSHE